MFILILVPLFIIGYSIYNWGITTVKTEITNSLSAQTDFYKTNLEKELQRIRILQYDILNDASLNELAVASLSLSDYDRDMNLNRVQQRIDAIKGSSRYIAEVKVVIPGIHKSINTPSILDMNEKDSDLVLQSPSMSILKLNYVNQQIILNSDSSNIGKTSDNTPLFYIFILLSETEISKMLEEMQTYEGSGSILFSTSNELVIESSSNKVLSQEMRSSLVRHQDVNFNIKNILELNKKQYYVNVTTMDQVGLTLVRYTPIAQVFQKIDHYRTLFWIFSCTTLIIICIFSISTYRFIHRPLSKLVKAFYRVEKGDITVEIKHNHQDEFKHIYERFNSMLSNLNSLIDQVYRQKILLQHAELKQLQTQITPHFLYNSFFILNRWIQRGYTEEAITFSKQLGSYFQFVTRSAAEEIPLAREVEHARTYTDIQTMRFSNRIQSEFAELPEKLGHMMVPRLLLQPIIENAFAHGLEDMEVGGRLVVSFDLVENELHLSIEDNGKNLLDHDLENMKRQLNCEDEHVEITGLLNIHRRIRLKFGKMSGIEVCRGELGGLKVTMRIEMMGA
ncbi:histidine kinase [Paenibacillus marchantiophytorum]|uniref:Histidine kinase n=2 Tax=Paenibacillus marchantiophytorum TaxID=1619310 RepID=A0ABQ2BUL5_9BACL|nr:histidine kinase [Paenibacillus marchantiophytorum]